MALKRKQVTRCPHNDFGCLLPIFGGVLTLWGVQIPVKIVVCALREILLSLRKCSFLLLFSIRNMHPHVENHQHLCGPGHREVSYYVICCGEV
jgi:hypothetical protein